MSYSPESTAAQLATTHPFAVRVLARHRIDYCCHGNRSLADVCQEQGLAYDDLAAEIEAARPAQDDGVDWSSKGLSQLIDYVLGTYHEPLYEELSRLVLLAQKVESVHGAHAPQMHEITKTLRAVEADLVPHMRKEEEILFPWIREGKGASAAAPIAVMQQEHVETGTQIARLRTLTDDYVVPEAACGSWRALWTGLEQLESDIHAHIHLENNILFPRALT